MGTHSSEEVFGVVGIFKEIGTGIREVTVSGGAIHNGNKIQKSGLW